MYANYPHFTPGDKVLFRGKPYDFGYYSTTQFIVILYEPGCRNMQDSFAVHIKEVSHETPTRSQHSPPRSKT